MIPHIAEISTKIFVFLLRRAARPAPSLDRFSKPPIPTGVSILGPKTPGRVTVKNLMGILRRGQWEGRSHAPIRSGVTERKTAFPRKSFFSFSVNFYALFPDTEKQLDYTRAEVHCLCGT